ncbi:MAG TPA: hypothetical protein VE134_05005 [Methanomicrobiales archaeon]|nr:hypothetical protein [Methanomicrobiales archaeon]
MGDIYQSDWFMGVKGQKSRIIFEEKGGIFYELLEYEDGKRDPFHWEGNLICGFYFTRMGMKCIPLPEPVIQHHHAFMKTLPRGTRVVRDATKNVTL